MYLRNEDLTPQSTDASCRLCDAAAGACSETICAVGAGWFARAGVAAMPLRPTAADARNAHERFALCDIDMCSSIRGFSNEQS